MKKITAKGIVTGLSIATALTLVACDNGNTGISENSVNDNMTFDVNNYPDSTLTQSLKDALAYMGNEERLAYDVYSNLYNHHLENGIEIKQLLNISQKSEIKHIGIVQSLVQKYDLGENDLSNVENPVADNSVRFENMPSGEYDIPKIQALYDELYAKGVDSAQDALEVGCMVEVVDVTDLDAYLALAQNSQAQDIIDAFNILREGSYNHYWAFDKGLKNSGISDGCCSLGDVYCHPEYPQNEKGNENSGNNNGNGGKGNGGKGRGNR